MIKTIDECFFQIQNGANIKQNDSQEGFPITRIETTANNKFNRNRMGYAGITDISKYESYVLEDEDLLMSHINSAQYLGRTVLYIKRPNETIIHGMNLLRLKANKRIINPAYARYYFYGNIFKKQIKNITKKSVNQASFSIKDLKRIQINVPNLEKQVIIVKILDKLQWIIERRKEQLNYLNDLIKARFVEMFGDPISNAMHWETVVLTSACKKIYGGGTPSKSHPEYFEGDIPWVSPKDMKTAVITDSIDHITDEAISNSTTSLVPEGSVLMVIRSGILKHDLPVAINAVPVTINQDMKAFVPGKNITASFLRNYFKTIEPDVLSGVRGVTADNIDFKAFQKRQIIMPPLKLQNAFEDFCIQVDKSKVVVQKALDEAQTLFDSLMQEYFG